MAQDCKALKKPHKEGKEVIRAITTSTEESMTNKEETTKKEQWRRLWEGASKDEKQEMMKDMGFQTTSRYLS